MPSTIGYREGTPSTPRGMASLFQKFYQWEVSSKGDYIKGS